MEIASLNEAGYASAYGILCAPLPGRNAREGLYPTFCRVPSEGRTVAHSHYEPELFFIVSGEGQMTIDERSAPVVAGDLVRIPPFSRHGLENTGGAELVFLSVYAEDFVVPPLPRDVLITAAPPTPNGPLHLGHLSGPYLAADILARHLRQRSSSVRMASGTDDHQNYVTERARSAGQATEPFRVSMRSRIEAGLRAFDICFDEFIEPVTDRDYQARARAFARRAIDVGAVVLDEREMPFCPQCEHYLVDALLDGFCPECEAPGSGGCEGCGVVVPPFSLAMPSCSRCKTPAIRRRATVGLFALSRHLPSILGELESLPLPRRIRELVERIAREKDFEVLVAYPGSDGAELAIPGASLAMHVWFEMAAHYESFAHHAGSWAHCFGFDNAFHYLLFIPALHRALDPKARLPEAVITNEFLLLDGEKFSTSRRRAIWADEYEVGSDSLRLFLCLNRPAHVRTSFDAERFDCFASELEKRLRELRARAGAVAEKSRKDERAIVECNRLTRELELLYSPGGFNPRQAAGRLIEFMDRAIHVRDAGEWLRLRALGTVMAPILPRESQELRAIFGSTSDVWVMDWAGVP